MIKKRMEATQRKQLILQAACVLAVKQGYRRLVRDDVAKAANVSGPLITHFFGDIRAFHTAVMQYAIDHEVITVIAQGLAIGDPVARNAPESLRATAILSLNV